jgi:hypothetical protein
MDFGEYRLVPEISGCVGCAFLGNKNICGVKEGLHYAHLGKLRCWVYKTNPASNYIYIKDTDEEYKQYCVNKLKFELTK